jgi:hypothetical protein
MGDPTDCELRDELPWLEGAFLTAIRTWVLSAKRGVSPEMPLQTLFAHLRASDATQHLDLFLQTLSSGCTRMISVYCTCEPVVGPDEMVLLDVFAVLQEGLHDTATDMLQKFANPTAAHIATGHALAISQILKDAGHTIARGPAALQRLGDIHPIPASARLH